LTVGNGKVRFIRDFRYVPYVMQEGTVVLA